MDPVFAMDETFSITRGSRLDWSVLRISIDQDKAAGAILQMKTS